MSKITLLSESLCAVLLLFGLVGIIVLLTTTSVKAQPSLQKAIANHINKVREDAVEYKDARKIVYGDIDGDGTKDAAVRYTLNRRRLE